jgi:integrase/recombinase XerD
MASHWPHSKLLQTRLAPSTARAYASEIAAYVRFCQAASAAPGQAESLASWRAHLMAQGTRPPTVNRKLGAVKQLMRAGADAGEVDAATAQAFAAVPGVPQAGAEPPSPVGQRLTAAMLRQLCDAPDPGTLVGCRDRALLATLACSGCRISEVVTLQVSQLQVSGTPLAIAMPATHQLAARQAPLSQEAYHRLQAWFAQRPLESPYCFTRFGGRGSRAEAEPLSPTGAWRIVQGYARQVGLPSLKTHAFRAFVGAMLTQRYGLRQAQAMLGHKRIESTARGYVPEHVTDGFY